MRAARALRRLCSAASRAPAPAPGAEEIKALPSNRAMRYVFMRTLPLVQQKEIDSVEATAGHIEHRLDRLLEDERSGVSDARSVVHLHTACMALAAYQTLAPVVGAERSCAAVSDAFGAGRTLPVHMVTKFALLFARDRLRFARRMADNARRDFGEAFDARVGGNEDMVQMRVHKCFYKQFFERHDAAALTKVFCQLDRDLFAPISERLHGLSFALPATLAEGGEACDFVFTRLPAK